MNDAHITLVGWVAADPFYTVTKNGNPFLSLRVGCTPRRFDRQIGQWQDGETMFMTVNCWRALADNVASSQLKLGDPVVVTGRLRIREYVKDEQTRFSAVVEAITLGHDLTRGHAHFQRVTRSAVATTEDQQEVEEHNDRFAVGESRTPAAPESEPWSDAAAGDPTSDAAQSAVPSSDDHGDRLRDDHNDHGDDVDRFGDRIAAA